MTLLRWRPITPTPTPAPSPTPLALTQIKPCPLPASHGTNDGCYEPKGAQAARLKPQMDAALARVMRERPDLFKFDVVSGGNPWVKDRTAYHVAYAAALGDLGVCANIEKEEMSVKDTNEFSEQWKAISRPARRRCSDGRRESGRLARCSTPTRAASASPSDQFRQDAPWQILRAATRSASCFTTPAGGWKYRFES
jgi:hypothetical protein